jgi:hypothetical protein
MEYPKGVRSSQKSRKYVLELIFPDPNSKAKEIIVLPLSDLTAP